MAATRTRLTGWGHFPVIHGILEQPRTIDELCARVRSGRPMIARGNGRAYGDAALNEHGTVSMLRFNRLLNFDERSGRLVCESGVLLDDVLNVFVPRGWFPPVTPGTRWVTLGGMIAADVHGKNHPAAGSIGAHVEWFDLMTADGEIVRCSRESHPALFVATLGGMGLTGVIVRCCLQLIRIATAYLKRSRIVASNLAETLSAFADHEHSAYRVAWIDCLARGASLGRALVDTAEHAATNDLPASLGGNPYRVARKREWVLPFTSPVTPLNSFTVRAFNALYFRAGALATSNALIDYHTWFYPLDSIRDWNRIYGRRGFTQYQCVLPIGDAASGLEELIGAISNAGCGSFLSVLKRLGPSSGALSFASEGYKLALDFPWSAKVARVLARLDEIVIRHGGHLYLAKDARMTRTDFEAMQPRVDSFRATRGTSGAAPVFQSLLSQRLSL